ncbi:MAG TPA: hypothetical protein VI006_14340 [Solirubrobacteraceae bacterium]
MPRPEDVPAEAVDPTAPLGEAPEALRPPRPRKPVRARKPAAAPRPPQPAPPRVPQPDPAASVPTAAPARRFARPKPWPEEARELWTCEIGWKAGYRKSTFRAMAAPPGSGKREPIGESPSVGWTLMADPEPPTPELALRVRALVNALEAAGWEHIGRGNHWYAQRLLWRGSGKPQRIPVPELVKTGESPEA